MMLDTTVTGAFISKALPFLAGAAGTYALFRLLFRSTWQSRPQVGDGWQVLVPGPTTWVALSLNLGLTLLLTYVYLFVGSARADAETQMRTLLILCVVFNLITAGVAYTIVAERVRWNDERIERRTLLFRTRSLAWDDLARFGDEATGYLWVEGVSGKRIRFSPTHKGIRDLIGKVLQHLPHDMPPVDQAVARAALQRYAPALAPDAR